MNATRIYTQELNFNNNAKVYLDEDNEIPSGEIGTKRYICCLSIGYFENYLICNGLLPRLSSARNSIEVLMLYNKQINGYQGFKVAFNNILNISKIESNYHFAWMKVYHSQVQ